MFDWLTILLNGIMESSEIGITNMTNMTNKTVQKKNIFALQCHELPRCLSNTEYKHFVSSTYDF